MFIKNNTLQLLFLNIIHFQTIKEPQKNIPCQKNGKSKNEIYGSFLASGIQNTLRH